jgi:hypothetical protein
MALEETAAGCFSDLTIDRLLVGELRGTPEQDAVVGHLATCATCRERRAVLEHAQLNPPPVRVAAHAPRASWRRTAPLSAALVAAGVAALFVVRRQTPPPATAGAHDEQLKGGGLVAEAVVRRADTGRVEPLAAGDELRAGDALRFRVRTPRAGYLVVLGVDARGAVSRYVPLAGTAARLAGPGEITPEGSVVLDGTEGREQIVFALCDTPAAAEAVAGAAARAARAGADLGALDVPCAQARVVYRKARAP